MEETTSKIKRTKKSLKIRKYTSQIDHINLIFCGLAYYSVKVYKYPNNLRFKKNKKDIWNTKNNCRVGHMQ